MDIKETREVVRALSAIAVRLVGDLGDGKISYLEIAGFLGDFGVIRDGLVGINKVPAELKDLDASERETLLADVGAALVGAGLSHRTGDIAEKILRWAFGTVNTLAEIRSLPPSALPA